MERYVCVHGHFYQPPRENPWLEAIEQQDSAYPYHDWNERITAECYGPNARSRILDAEGRIYDITNNYGHISYNVGPTLLKWLDESASEIYARIIDADRKSMERFSGHGSAIAQPYNHMIMPLANERDRWTQIAWGIHDFKKRFGRDPEGMWLPETAVDLGTLDLMGKAGITFTILEPGQAKRIKGRSSRAWTDTNGGNIDPTRPYYVRLPSGGKMNVFFYDGPISRAVAFENLLDSGESFSNRLAGGFSDERHRDQLVNIATDGESYGHHHRFGDMALAYALDYIEKEGVAKVTNYSEYLANHPAEWEVEIWDNTSWSCAHGIERWRSNCGCNTGGHPNWTQEWRAPLRNSLDWLRDTVAPLYEQKAGELLRDPWEARNDYIDVILNRDDDNVAAYLRKHGSEALTPERTTETLELLELQRHALLMYTSCGWFFDDLSGIETTQVIQYAGRVIQLAARLFGDGEIESEFLNRLAEARSNIPENRDGRVIWEKFVRPAAVDLSKVGAHYAVSSLFEDYPSDTRIFCYHVESSEYERQGTGIAQMAVGRAKLASIITGEADEISFGVLHFGDHNMTAGVRPFSGDEGFARMRDDAFEAFSRADLPEVIRLLDRHFGELTYSLRSLFRDEQRKVLASILESSVAEAEASYRQVFDHHAPLMRFLMDIGFPMPAGFQSSAELVLNGNLRREMEEAPIDPERIDDLLTDVRAWKINLDEEGIAYTAEHTLEDLARRLHRRPDDLEILRQLESSAAAVRKLPFDIEWADIQNSYWEILNNLAEYDRKASRGDAEARKWVELFRALGTHLTMRVDG